MLSGSDLVRTSGHLTELAQKLKVVDSPAVKAVESPPEGKQGLDEDTQNALVRFARFINKEGQKKHQPKPIKSAPKALPKAYLTQVEALDQDERSGGILNIYI